MKKIAIATWVGKRSLNYGCISQAYAMQELIHQCNCKPITINHFFCGEIGHREIRKKYYILLKTLGVKWGCTWIKFERFYKKNMKLSSMCKSDRQIIEYIKKRKIDILLCGSDAIWFSTYIRSFFLWDYDELVQPRVAYGPSVPRWGIEYANMKNALKKYVAVSGREFEVANLLETYTDKKVDTVLDPVLTVDESFWEKNIYKRLIREPYILCYILANPEYHAVSIEMIQKKYRVNRVVYVNTDYIDRIDRKYSDYRGCCYNGCVGPVDFWSLFKYATAICTDSFHGACFSVVFRKNFFVLSRPIGPLEEDNRFRTLFKQLQLPNRFVTKNNMLEKMEDINYVEVEKQLLKKREDSIRYLKNAIQKCEEVISIND